MLRICTKKELDLYADYAYQLALTPEKCSYPVYFDGVKTKEMFIQRLSEALESKNDEILLFEQDGRAEGLICYFWFPEDRYLQLSVFSINNKPEKAMEEFLEWVGKRFKGYDLYLGFPEDNVSAIQYLKNHGGQCIESLNNNIAFLDKMDDIPKVNGLIHIDKTNYEIFKRLHDQIEGDMYWNSERILADIDNWSIFAAEKKGEYLGAIYYMADAMDDMFEIFGVDMNNKVFDADIFKTLLMGTLFDIKGKGGRFITFFCDEEGEKETLECGFELVGKYACYIKHLG